jgi:hypothetical protein
MGGTMERRDMERYGEIWTMDRMDSIDNMDYGQNGQY